MTENEAQQTVAASEQIASALLNIVYQISKPDTAIVAVGLVAGVIFANLEYEDNIDMDEMFENWLDAVKAQYKESKEKIEKHKTAQ